MHVVWHAPDLDGLHLVLPGDAAQEGPESLAQRWRDQGPTLFGAEDAMEMGADARHTTNSAVPDLCNVEIESPTLKRWAIIICPSGTGEQQVVVLILQ